MKPYRLPPTGVVYPPRQRDGRALFRAFVESDPAYVSTMDWLCMYGTYEAVGGVNNPVVLQPGDNNFIDSLRRSYKAYGTLTNDQLRAAKAIYAGRVEGIEKPAQEAALADTTQFFSIVHAIAVFDLSVLRTVPVDSLKDKATMMRKHAGPETHALMGTTPCGCTVMVWSTLSYPQGSVVRVRATVTGHVRRGGLAVTTMKNLEVLSTRKRRRVG